MLLRTDYSGNYAGILDTSLVSSNRRAVNVRYSGSLSCRSLVVQRRGGLFFDGIYTTKSIESSDLDIGSKMTIKIGCHPPEQLNMKSKVGES